MDQGIIASFKAYYLRRTFSQTVKATQDDAMTLKEFWRNYKNIADSWEEVKKTNMKRVWNKLCPQFADGFKEFTTEDIAEARLTVVDIGNNQLQLDINEDDALDLFAFHVKELTNEDLMELEQQHLRKNTET
ncbi:hypothetical protein chiPu_0008083 [Chiloscyllium punctatum]|uniref:DDE-1 domain-containing protein n=1 Tax=Chiloscyllium punctatum TaxID=137246 RepID=A0A401SH19_CHIPU|nr:hypothetical protein [Chiloscyllium punctatum]